jgi:hypothetical protein
MEVFAEKMLQACHALLGLVAELKRNALLNDVRGRNTEARRRLACGLPVVDMCGGFVKLQAAKSSSYAVWYKCKLTNAAVGCHCVAGAV